jgi:RND family efflux transporter MFP subunit
LKSAADVKLATVTRDRVAKLVEQGVFSKQQGDDSAAQLEVREAELIAARATIQAAEQTVHAQEAEVQRIEELSAFKLVRAPFDGIITVRNCATGNLVTPSAANGGRELYRMANYDVLRVFVAVPQANLLDVATGQAAEVLANEIGSRKFTGKVVRSASALDETTRTERTEVRVENRDHALLPGMYVQVRFLSPKPRTMVVIPGDTLLTPASGPQVAVVGEGNKVRFQKVEVGRDLGTQVEVINGLAGGESLIVNPSDAVRPGIRVRPVPRK